MQPINRDTPPLDSPPSSPPLAKEPLLKLPQYPQSPPPEPYQSLKYDDHNNNEHMILYKDVFDETSQMINSKNTPPLDESYLKLWVSKLINTKPPKEEEIDTKNNNVSGQYSTPITPPAPCSSPTTQTVTNCINFENVLMNIHQIHFDLNRSDDEGFMVISPSENDIINHHLGNFDNIGAPCDFAGTPSTTMMGAGLVNLGNMCFMNVILQCFTHTVPFVHELRSCSHVTPCEDYTNDYARLCVICVLRQHIETCIACSGGVVCPVGLVDNLGNFSSSFRRYQQSDAHEFMLSLVNKLQRCFLEGEENVIDKVFGGLLLSKLQCCSCAHSSNSYEPMIDMSLEIEDVNTIQHALNSFTVVEKMDEKFTCDGCLKQVSMEKQLMLNKAPMVLVFHLKRFKNARDYVKKIEAHVNFTLDLDLEPYTTRNPNDNVGEILKYDLYALVVHEGSNPSSGHYYCFIRSAPEKWHKFDDDQVTSVSRDYVLGQQAYILFYVKQGIPWFSSSIIKSDENPKELNPCFDDGVMDEKKPNSYDRNFDDDPMDIYAYEEKKNEGE